MDKLRQGGRVFKYQILACVRGLPTSQVACALANPPYSSAPSTPPTNPAPSAKSSFYLSRSPASHQCWPQLSAQLLITCQDISFSSGSLEHV